MLTVREAIRRADTRVIYEALSENFKRREGIPGSLEAELAWKKIQEQYSGVHMLGYAEMSEPESLPDGRVRYLLTVSGYAFALTFVRQPYWEALWGEDDEAGEFVETLDDRAWVVFDEDEGTTRISIEIPTRLTPDGIVRAGVGHDWKLDEMRGVDL